MTNASVKAILKQLGKDKSQTDVTYFLYDLWEINKDDVIEIAAHLDIEIDGDYSRESLVRRTADRITYNGTYWSKFGIDCRIKVYDDEGKYKYQITLCSVMAINPHVKEHNHQVVADTNVIDSDDLGDNVYDTYKDAYEAAEMDMVYYMAETFLGKIKAIRNISIGLGDKTYKSTRCD